MKQIDYLSYMNFQPLGYIPKKAFEAFKEKNKNCIILENKQGKWIVSLTALQIEQSDLDKMAFENKKEKT